MKKTTLLIAAVAVACATFVGCNKQNTTSNENENESESVNASEEVAKAPTDFNKAAGLAFMDSIAKVPDVKPIGANIYCRVIKEGDGPKPTAENTVKVNYEGRLIDGTVFDSSYSRGEAAEFPIGGLIQGWQHVLKNMPVGSTWEVFIPYYYAYGEAGTPGIPPYSTLIFKMELLDIVN